MRILIAIGFLLLAHQGLSTPNLDTFLDDEDSGAGGSGDGGDIYGHRGAPHNTAGGHSRAPGPAPTPTANDRFHPDNHNSYYDSFGGRDSTFDDHNFTSYDDEDYANGDYGSGDYYDGDYDYTDNYDDISYDQQTTSSTTSTTSSTTTSTTTTTTTTPPPPPSSTTTRRTTTPSTTTSTSTTTTEVPRSIIEESGLHPSEEDSVPDDDYYEDYGDYEGYDDEDYHGSGYYDGDDKHHAPSGPRYGGDYGEEEEDKEDHFSFDRGDHFPEKETPRHQEPNFATETEIESDREHPKGASSDMETFGGGMQIVSKEDDRQVSVFAQPGILAAFIGGAVVGLLCAILLVMFVVYRMRKKDEGSYPLDEPKRVPLTSSYATTDKEIYA